MRKIMLTGRSECGKTTLTQALKGNKIAYQKTQSIDHGEFLIDTPGEYIQDRHLGAAVALYAYEAEVVGLLLSATEPYTLYGPCITSMCNREVIGIVTKINDEGANPERAEGWLRLAGCEKIFFVDSVTGEGIDKLIKYLEN